MRVLGREFNSPLAHPQKLRGRRDRAGKQQGTDQDNCLRMVLIVNPAQVSSG